MRKHALQLASLLGIALAVALFAPPRAAADDDDPPTRVARLSHTDGSVSFEPAGTDDWVSAVVNRPMTTGDKLWSDNGARAELHIGSASIRLGSTTGFSFLNLTDEVTQIQITEGSLRVRVKRLDEHETFEIDTPNLAFSVLRPGTYRIDVNEAGDTTVVNIRSGEGEVTGGGQAFTIHSEQTATFTGTDQLDADVQDLAGYDGFDRWCTDRDRREDRSTSARYVSSDVIGYEDLDEYGGWREVPEYGTIWFPHTVVVDWAPYRYGHWAYIAPWGYTWVEDEPWGFAPFHYGRWVTVGGVWGWVPCRPAVVVGVAYVRPVYAPALVAWVGGPHFAVGVGIGGGGGVGVGWFPLGPREVYVPSYRVSRNYVNNVNVSNTTVNTTVVNNYYNTTVVNKNVNVTNVNVTNVKYVNQGVPGAVTATSHESFASGQPVARNALKIDQREMARAPVAVGAPTVAPTRQAFQGGSQVSTVRPPASFANRAVVAKTAPPPPPPPVDRQQAAIKQNGGQPLAISQVHQLQPANAPAAAHGNVRIAPPSRPATPVTPQNVQANRPVQPQNNSVGRPVQPQNNAAVTPVQPNNNRPVSMPNNAGNKPGNPPANVSQRGYNDRPPTARTVIATPTPSVNPQVEQKQQQQIENLHKQQDLERQRIERQQEADHQRMTQQRADDQRKQQLEQQHQQQLEQLERKHDQQTQQVQQKQQQERQQQERVQQQRPPQQHPTPPPAEKPKDKDKPPKP
jgi:uncharacterized protein DUF6600